MTRLLRSSVRNKRKEELSSKLKVCNKSNVNKKRAKSGRETNIRENQRNYIWNINIILSNIFAYTEYRDLIEFNTVCRRWNYLTNSIIRNSIKLQRRRAIQNKVHDKRFNRAAKTDAEVEMCIASNSKYASFVKKLNFNEKLEPQRAIQFFETFRSITNLTLESVEMSQDQFIGMIRPLNQLKELNLKCFSVKKIVKNRFITESIQLPSTLTKLTMDYVYTIRNPELFIQTINSHSNLTEFIYITYNHNSFLNPFLNHYPSLKNLEYHHEQLENPQILIDIFEFNPQLVKLHLELTCWNNALTSHLSRHLTNLKDFYFFQLGQFRPNRQILFLKFIQPTKIKKLTLRWDNLSSCSLESILLNCPDLDELSLNLSRSYLSPESFTSIFLTNPTSIRKLQIIVDNLREPSLSSILDNCPQLKDLDIHLPRSWKQWVKAIGSKCTKLEQLKICPAGSVYGEQKDKFLQELYESKFLTTNCSYKSTLTHLILNHFNFFESKEEYFNSFENLRYIEYPSQMVPYENQSNNEIIFNNNLWPSYRLVFKDQTYNTNIKMVKL
ncbi:hypothetical protein CONCODRAFT_12300 [Conidiobolus coronatus NRRL 28638]|uniref:F-box domain-containing protein n=1 Tax=Conidiobolus coronatus (strain ATCC 28846 / CBS 209.66 / NRRL 28638) TaxID=796925 RepID=A0A137NT48_CONC2|nr:hypothetical protein CONCODRAFT_12300 [Conidiobolus coronatus NRRL 28638]|eukprot:KXN65967.1 hypothetical protein CONCODRAFT_12300 [Conidiobolus coronatus NRRL 28638]